MIGFNVQILGLDKAVRDYSTTYPNLIKNNINKGLTKIGFLVQGKARDYAPYLNGDLERSIKFKVHGSDNVEIYVPANSRAGQYAYKMHYGNYNPGPGTRSKTNAGRLYIQRAIDDNKDKIKSTMNAMAFKGVKD